MGLVKTAVGSLSLLTAWKKTGPTSLLNFPLVTHASIAGPWARRNTCRANKSINNSNRTRRSHLTILTHDAQASFPLSTPFSLLLIIAEMLLFLLLGREYITTHAHHLPPT